MDEDLIRENMRRNRQDPPAWKRELLRQIDSLVRMREVQDVFRKHVQTVAQELAEKYHANKSTGAKELLGPGPGLTLPEKFFILAAFHDVLCEAERMPRIMDWDLPEFPKFHKDARFPAFCMYAYHAGQCADLPDEKLQPDTLRRYIKEVKAELVRLSDEARKEQTETDGGTGRQQLCLKDWLWRLDRIQKELGRLLPENNLHVAFSLKVDSATSSNQEIRTFPFGTAVSGATWSVAKYQDPETGALWFDLGGQYFGPFVVCWDVEVGWSLQPRMPEGFFPKEKDEFIPAETLGWCRWYYLKGDEEKAKAAREEIGSKIVEIEEAILEACALAPKTLHKGMHGGDLSQLGCWPTALFYLALKRVHPLIQAFGTHTPNHPVKHGTDQDCSFTGLNDRVIMLSPDIRTATEYAFDAMRHIAEAVPRRQQSAGEALMGSLTAGERKDLQEKVRASLRAMSAEILALGQGVAEWQARREGGLKRLAENVEQAAPIVATSVPECGDPTSTGGLVSSRSPNYLEKCKSWAFSHKWLAGIIIPVLVLSFVVALLCGLLSLWRFLRGG